MWDCNAFLSKDLFHELLALEPPLKAIAISHPHVGANLFHLLQLTNAFIPISVLLDQLDLGTLSPCPAPHRSSRQALVSKTIGC